MVRFDALAVTAGTTWGTENARTDALEATDRVHVCVDADGTASGATLTARWPFERPTVAGFHIRNSR